MAFSCKLFSQKAPSQTFNRVLNAPLGSILKHHSLLEVFIRLSKDPEIILELILVKLRTLRTSMDTRPNFNKYKTSYEILDIP